MGTILSPLNAVCHVIKKDLSYDENTGGRFWELGLGVGTHGRVEWPRRERVVPGRG